MTFWRDVRWLVTFELKHSWKHYGFSLLILMGLFFLFRTMIPEYFAQASMGLDFIFMLSFVLFSQLSRPKQFQLQKISGIHYAAPILITLNQLAINKQKIVVSRFIVYLITYGIFSILLLISLYPYFHAYMTLSGYLVFSIIWLAFGIYIGGVNPAYEVYSNVAWNIFYACFIGTGIVILYTQVFYRWYHHGLVGWTVDMATHYPLISLTVSIMLVAIALIFWMKVMKRRMERSDYFA